MTLNIAKELDEQCVIVSLKGNLTIESSDALIAEIREYFEREDTPIILDLKKLNFIDSTGVGALVHIRNQFRNQDSIVLSSVPNRIMATIELLGITDIIKVYPNNAEAVIELRK